MSGKVQDWISTSDESSRLLLLLAESKRAGVCKDHIAREEARVRERAKALFPNKLSWELGEQELTHLLRQRIHIFRRDLPPVLKRLL